MDLVIPCAPHLLLPTAMTCSAISPTALQPLWRVPHFATCVLMIKFFSLLLRSPSAERSMEASKSNADGKREGPSDATPAPGRWKVSRALRDAIVWMKRASTAQLQLLLSCGTGDEAEGGERLDEDRESETQDRPFSHVLFWGSMYTVGAR